MKTASRLTLCVILIFTSISRGYSQTADSARYHIAVFLPLYLDSAYDASGANH